MSKSPVEKPDEDAAYRPLGIAVPSEKAGARVDAYLARHFPFLSRAAWQKRLRQGELYVDGDPVDVAYRLREGQQLAMHHPPSTEPEVDRGIYPIWRKGAVMAVFKPAPLPMHENGAYRKNTFAELVKMELGPEWAAVHRLDRETSGIVLCGATHAVRQQLSLSLAERTLYKEYLGIARGQSSEQRWIETGPIGDLVSSDIRIKKWVVPDGQSAETHFQVLEQRGEHCLLRAIPKTGRTNQIRIHAAYRGLPLVGDRLFHPDEQVFLEWFVHGLTDHVVQKSGYKRCLLHAHALAFKHPEDLKVHEVRCEMPDDMRSFWG
ncbi:MAG: RluA family pseudouridine synthase [Proteobacteria bacterium]|nr:RluA family pseudouridine synthase [Pseudomonadota bacterium]